jgi:hypothetical protein
MAFIPLAFAGGMAKRGSEILKEEREEALSMTEDALKTWTATGLPLLTKRKEESVTNENTARSLERDYGFSVEQIAVIMGQGKGAAVIDHIDKQRNKYGQTYAIPHGDIVTISGTYDDTGLTIDQVLENVQGKVNRGMSVSDAIQDVTGQDTGGLTGFFGGDNTALMKQKMDAFGVAAGIDVAELRGLAAGDITYDEPLRTGTISLDDPADEPLKTSFINRFEKFAVIGLGGKANIVDGQVQTEDMTNETLRQASVLSAEANKRFKEFQEGGRMSETEAYAETLDFIQTETAKLRDPIPPEGKLSDMSGVALSQLPDRIFAELQGVEGRAQMLMLGEAEQILFDAYIERGENETFARNTAKEQVNRIKARLEEQ